MSQADLIKNIKLAFELQKQGHYKEAIGILYKVLAVEPDNIDIIVQIAFLFYAKHDIDIAIEYYEKALALDSKNITALDGLLKVYKGIKDYKKALLVSNKILEVAPNINSFITHISILCLNQEYLLAVKCYETSQFSDIDNSDLSFYIGYACFKLEDYQRAKQFFEKTIDKNPANTEATFYLAKIIYDEKDYAFSEFLLKNILNERQSAKTYNLLGLIKLTLDDIPKAINYFSYATKINNNIPEYFYNLALAYALNGWYGEAEKNYKKSISLNGDNLDYHYSLAYLYYERKDLKKAKEELEVILDKDKNHADSEILYALICASEGQILYAKRVLEKLVENKVQSDFIYYALAKIYRQLQMFDDAISNIHKALKLLPNSLEYLSELADCYLLKNDIENAGLTVDLILSKNKNYVYAYILKAKIAIKNKNYAEALQSVETAINFDTNYDYAYFMKASIFFNERNINYAIEHMKTAIGLNPNNIDYYEYLANIYFEIEDYDSAFDYYKEIASLKTSMSSDNYLKIAFCAEKLNMQDTAKKNYLAAYRIEPQNSLIVTEYAHFLERNGKYTQALKFLKNIIKKAEISPFKSVLVTKYLDIKNEHYNELSPIDKVKVFCDGIKSNT